MKRFRFSQSMRNVFRHAGVVTFIGQVGERRFSFGQKDLNTPAIGRLEDRDAGSRHHSPEQLCDKTAGESSPSDTSRPQTAERKQTLSAVLAHTALVIAQRKHTAFFGPSDSQVYRAMKRITGLVFTVKRPAKINRQLDPPRNHPFRLTRLSKFEWPLL